MFYAPLIPASIPQTMAMQVITEKPLDQIATEFQYGQGTTERNSETSNLCTVHTTQGFGGTWLLTEWEGDMNCSLRGTEDTKGRLHLFEGIDRLHWFSAFPYTSSKGHPKSLSKLPSMVVKSSVWKSRVLLLQICCYLLLLNCSYSWLNLWLANWLVCNLWLITSCSQFPLHLSGQFFALRSRSMDRAIEQSLTNHIASSKQIVLPTPNLSNTVMWHRLKLCKLTDSTGKAGCKRQRQRRNVCSSGILVPVF